MSKNASRASGVFAFAVFSGAALLIVSGYLHPSGADPNDAVAAFTEYAADRWWIATHLLQLAGFAFLTAALVELGRRLEAVPAQIASAFAAAGLAAAAALQAVDGIALKAMVDARSAAPASEKQTAFWAAFAVRQIEIGFAAATCLLFGVSALLYGAALFRADYRRLAALGSIGGAMLVILGVAFAYTGFSSPAMTLNHAAFFIVIAWMASLAVFMKQA